MYWVLIFDPDKPLTFMYINFQLVHVVPIVTLLIEFFLVNWLFDYKHFIFGFTKALIYLIINVLSQVINGKNPYKFLDWRYGTTYLIAMGVLVLYVAICAGLTFITKVRQD